MVGSLWRSKMLYGDACVVKMILNLFDLLWKEGVGETAGWFQHSSPVARDDERNRVMQYKYLLSNPSKFWILSFKRKNPHSSVNLWVISAYRWTQNIIVFLCGVYDMHLGRHFSKTKWVYLEQKSCWLWKQILLLCCSSFRKFHPKTTK